MGKLIGEISTPCNSIVSGVSVAKSNNHTPNEPNEHLTNVDKICEINRFQYQNPRHDPLGRA